MGPNSAECLKGGKGKGNVLYPLTYIHTYSILISSYHCHSGQAAPAFGAYENAEFIIENIQRQKNQSVFIVANIGLWYNEEEIFEKVYIDA